MPDNLTAEQRRRAMQRTSAQRDTKPELALRRALWAAGVRGWRLHRKDLPGRPDLAFGKARLAVFVDGAFWHGREDKWWPGRSGDYWDKKIARNKERDLAADEALADQHWRVLRLWDDEIMKDPQAAAQRVAAALVGRTG